MEKGKDAASQIQEIDDWLERLERLKDNADFQSYDTLLKAEILTVDSHMTTCNDPVLLMRMQGEKNGLKRASGMVRRAIKDLRQKKENLIGKSEKHEEAEDATGGY